MEPHKLIKVIAISFLFFGFFFQGKAENFKTIKPIIRYEISGGAGHYNYAPSAIVDKYGICYMYLCQNRDPFKIVDFIYLYKGCLLYTSRCV